MAASSKRIQNELAEISRKPMNGFSAGPKDGNIYSWSCAITGPAGSPYEGGIFFLDLALPLEYPSAPPKVTFRTPIYHCNIRKDGSVGLDILHEAWRPALTIPTVLTAIQELLAEPRPEQALVGSVAHLYIKERAAHDNTAADWTRRFAKL
eukprot:jgi/Ulvmu1/1904/UM012_0063.1